MWLLYFLLAALVLLVPFLKKFVKIYRNKQIVKSIPGPPEKFLTGHLYLLTALGDTLFERTRAFSNEFRPIYRFSAFYANIVNFLHPDDIELILSPSKHLSKSLVYSFLHSWLGTGLLTSTGAKWHKRRKILTPAFHFNILQQFLNVFNQETDELVEVLAPEAGKVIDVVPPVTRFTLQSILETAMGLSKVDENSKRSYKDCIYEMGRIFLKRLEKPIYRVPQLYQLSKLAKQEKEIVKVLHDFSDNIIKKREEIRKLGVTTVSKKNRMAMLDLLLTAKQEGAEIDFEGIREEVDTFTFEGHDTTAMAISYLFLVLANLPTIQETIFEEVVDVLGDNKHPTTDDLNNLKYTERCIKETLRLFPSVPLISRWASESFNTKTGHRIPEGTIMHIHIFDVHRDPDLYPDPLKFDPDRFLPEIANQRHPFAYIPFSAGPRNCIGQRFALMELKAVLCGIVRKFKFEKVDDMHDIAFQSDLVLRPKNAIKVKILKRS